MKERVVLALAAIALMGLALPALACPCEHAEPAAEKEGGCGNCPTSDETGAPPTTQDCCCVEAHSNEAVDLSQKIPATLQQVEIVSIPLAPSTPRPALPRHLPDLAGPPLYLTDGVLLN